MNKQEGFTIIELVIVIAIISILTAITLAGVIGYLNNAKDTSIKGNLNTILISSSAYFDLHSNFTDFFTDKQYADPAAQIKKANGEIDVVSSLNSTNKHFCACSILKASNGDSYCVDDTGYRKETGNVCSARCFLGACLD